MKVSQTTILGVLALGLLSSRTGSTGSTGSAAIPEQNPPHNLPEAMYMEIWLFPRDDTFISPDSHQEAFHEHAEYELDRDIEWSEIAGDFENERLAYEDRFFEKHQELANELVSQVKLFLEREPWVVHSGDDLMANGNVSFEYNAFNPTREGFTVTIRIVTRYPMRLIGELFRTVAEMGYGIDNADGVSFGIRAMKPVETPDSARMTVRRH